MTHPTKSIYKLILQDYIRVSHLSVEDVLYTEQDLLHSMDKIDVLNFHEVVHHKGIKFWSYNAGHVLGAAMFVIEIAGVRILYTGDYSRREDRHLMCAELPESSIDVLIVEATYGIQRLPPVAEREKRFTELVRDIVEIRRGKCLLPVFALGRAQELLLILDEYWAANPPLQHIPIYYASALAKKCMSTYQTYINMMNKRIQTAAQVSNPFQFKHIFNLKSGNMDTIEDAGPCVVMASPGMLQNGLSRELLEMWAGDAENGCIITGYAVEGTLAKHILTEPEYIQTMNGGKMPLNMSVTYISFSAHADYTETSEFVDLIKAPYVVSYAGTSHGIKDNFIRLLLSLAHRLYVVAFSCLLRLQILVHGDASEGCGRLRYALESKYTDGSIRIIAPRNLQTVELQFRAQKVAKTVGALAAIPPTDGTKLSGLLIRKNFVDYTLMKEEELAHFTALSSTTVEQSIKVPFHQTFACMKYFVGQMYELDEEEQVGESKPNESKDDSTKDADSKSPESLPSDAPFITVHNSVRLTYLLQPSPHVLVTWKSNPVNDMLSDSLIAILTNIQSNPGMAKVIGSQGECRNANATGHTHKHDDAHSHQHHGSSSTNTDTSSSPDPFTPVKPIPSSTSATHVSAVPSFRWFLEQHYGSDLVYDDLSRTYSFNLNTIPCRVHMDTLNVICSDPELRRRIGMMVRRAHAASQPITRMNTNPMVIEESNEEDNKTTAPTKSVE